METIDQYRQKTLNQQAASGMGNRGAVEWGMKIFHVPYKKQASVPEIYNDWEDATDFPDCTSYNPSMPRGG